MNNNELPQKKPQKTGKKSIFNTLKQRQTHQKQTF